MYQRIMVAVDGSATSSLALEEAVKLARDQRAHLRVLYVVDIDVYIGEGVNFPRLYEAWRTAGQRVLDHAAAVAREAGLEPELALVDSDGRRISDVIAAEAQQWPADLLVIGTHGRHGIAHLVLGSVAEGVVRAASVPVLLIRGHEAAERPRHRRRRREAVHEPDVRPSA